MTRARSRPIKCSAVISDVDGTLVTDDKILTARTVVAAAALRANGMLFSIISSRPPRGLRMLIAPLGITAPIVCFNGGMLVTANLAVISAHLLSPGVLGRQNSRRKADALPVFANAVTHAGAAHCNRTDAGHDLAFSA